MAGSVLVAGLAIAGSLAGPREDQLNARGILALLDVMDAVAALHPGFEEKRASLEEAHTAERQAASDEARKRNEASPELGAALDAMMATATYQIYFRRFPNVTPELVRDLILDLPYRRRAAPGDIGVTLWDLLARRRQVRAGLVRFLETVDMDRVRESAVRWSPGGPHDVPTVHLVYDSNAGSFAAEGRPFLNLYSEGYFETPSPGARVIAAIEGTMAHEIQHALAEPYLYPDRQADLPWKVDRVDQLLRSMVGEGVAFHCDPPGGPVREVYEDETVVATLLRRLEAFLADLRHDRLTEEEARAWSRANYFDEAFALLRRHLEPRYSGAELEAKVAELAPIRPDLEHVLGWWMVSRISRGGARRDLAVGLLTDPWVLLARYNEAAPDDQPALRLDPDALADLAALQELQPAAEKKR